MMTGKHKVRSQKEIVRKMQREAAPNHTQINCSLALERSKRKQKRSDELEFLFKEILFMIYFPIFNIYMYHTISLVINLLWVAYN